MKYQNIEVHMLEALDLKTRFTSTYLEIIKSELQLNRIDNMKHILKVLQPYYYFNHLVFLNF